MAGRCLEQWLLKFANQSEMGWPPPDPIDGHRWGLLLTYPISWWKDVTRTQETRDCSFDNLSNDARKTMNSMYDALVEGKDNGFGGDNSPARFQRQLRILVNTGEFERSPVLFPIESGLSPLDGNHRLFALQAALNTPLEYFEKHNAKQPSALQKVWIASTRTAKIPGNFDTSTDIRPNELDIWINASLDEEAL